MTKRNYLLKIRNKQKNLNSQYLQYLLDNSDTVDLTSKICVQIPAFYDPEIMRTVQSCIDTAANPDRVSIAICYQGDNTEELEQLKKIPNCKIKHVPRKDAKGTCAARYECNKLITDEEYVLHVDSHMLFGPYWDTCLIQQWLDCNDDKAIVSAYCNNSATYISGPYDYDDLIPKKVNGRFINASVFQDNTVKIRARAVCAFEQDNTKPRRAALTCAHCAFGKAEIDKLMPFDPNMYFVADEISMSVRYWTHGYNVYQPAFRSIYHLYDRTGFYKKEKNKKIERFNNANAINETPRMEQLFRVKDHGFDLTGFDIGTERTIEDFEKFAGINFKNLTMTNFAYRGAYDIEHSDKDNELYDWRNVADRERIDYEKQQFANKTIYVMIPSYKDPYLMMTVRSFIDNADHPERIHIGVCYQDDDMDTYAKLKEIPNCKIVHVKPENAKGVGHAYHLLEDHLDGEDYVLLTESHIYAVKGWDTYMITEHSKLGNKAVISNWLCGFDPDNTPTEPIRFNRIIGIGNIASNGHLHILLGAIMHKTDPARGCCIIGQDVFGSAQLIKDCKHDPNMLMNTCESSFTYALWTHGYDVYHTHDRYLFHHYAKPDDTNDEVYLLGRRYRSRLPHDSRSRYGRRLYDARQILRKI